jgi:hypothetical protein
MIRRVATWATLAGLSVAPAGCGGGTAEAPPETAATAPAAPTPEETLRAGQPQVALRLLRLAHGGAGVDLADRALLARFSERERVVVAAASLDTGHWEDAASAIRAMQDPRHAALLGCYLAGRRGDIDAARRCEATLATPSEGVEPVARASGRFGLAVAREHDRRVDAAAEALRQAVSEAPHPRNQRVLLDFLERQGWVKEAIETLEGWRTAAPDDKTILDRLVKALERKVRGDLLEKRGAEAELAARRLIELAPARAGTWRYHLADALEQLGKAEEAARERAAAKASGAPEPKRPDAVRELDPATWPAELRPPAGAPGAPSAAPPEAAPAAPGGPPAGTPGALPAGTPGAPPAPAAAPAAPGPHLAPPAALAPPR